MPDFLYVECAKAPLAPGRDSREPTSWSQSGTWKYGSANMGWSGKERQSRFSHLIYGLAPLSRKQWTMSWRVPTLFRRFFCPSE